MTYFDTTKTGRLKAPACKEVPLGLGYEGLNKRGQKVAAVGDYILCSGRGVSVGTIGRVMSIDDATYSNDEKPPHTANISVKYELLDGTKDTSWSWYLTPIDAAAVKEVIDFYKNKGQEDLIKVGWIDDIRFSAKLQGPR